MSSTPPLETALVAVSTPSPVAKPEADYSAFKFSIDDSIPDEERHYYHKSYPAVDLINQRKVHCTVCRNHIGTAPNAESNIKMHPILRVTHCVKCHDFYNSGEFSKGEDGSELYCRWCGQGGEVYCCSNCPYVFCKSCILKNLNRGVIVDIERNDNWNCFRCSSKILWPLRAQHWALTNYIHTQKKAIKALQLPEPDQRQLMTKDNSTCCRYAKSKASGLSDSMESLESNVSKRSHASSSASAKKQPKVQGGPAAKRPKSSNDEVVCTPDLLSMLEPDCQISVQQKSPSSRPITHATNMTTTPRIVAVQQNFTGPNASSNSNTPRSSLPPPLVLSNTAIRYRQAMPSNAPTLVRRTVLPNAGRNAGPVFHTINGFRVDLNSAAQQDSYRLPNGRLIQVKRQLPIGGQPAQPQQSPQTSSNQIGMRPRAPYPESSARMRPGASYGTNMGIYNPQSQRLAQIVRINNGTQIQAVPATVSVQQQPQNTATNGVPVVMTQAGGGQRPGTLVRHTFPNDAIGAARTKLQEQVFNAMEICTHLTGKVQTLTNSNAYNSARSYLDLKELYIHLSYLMTYAIGRFKGLQEKCLGDMRDLGFTNDANSLENGQLAAEKQASDDEDNEIEIVEPKTDTITIDSDNEDEVPTTSSINHLKITSVKSTAKPIINIPPPQTQPTQPEPSNLEGFFMDSDVSSFTSSILASMLEVDITEGSPPKKRLMSPGGTIIKKQPRKKTTNKPNPALLQLERERMEDVIRTDPKLKMQLKINLLRIENEHPVARKWAEELKKPESGSVDKRPEIGVATIESTTVKDHDYTSAPDETKKDEPKNTEEADENTEEENSAEAKSVVLTEDVKADEETKDLDAENAVIECSENESLEKTTAALPVVTKAAAKLDPCVVNTKETSNETADRDADFDLDKSESSKTGTTDSDQTTSSPKELLADESATSATEKETSENLTDSQKGIFVDNENVAIDTETNNSTLEAISETKDEIESSDENSENTESAAILSAETEKTVNTLQQTPQEKIEPQIQNQSIENTTNTTVNILEVASENQTEPQIPDRSSTNTEKTNTIDNVEDEIQSNSETLEAASENQTKPQSPVQSTEHSENITTEFPLASPVQTSNDTFTKVAVEITTETQTPDLPTEIAEKTCPKSPFTAETSDGSAEKETSICSDRSVEKSEHSTSNTAEDQDDVADTNEPNISTTDATPLFG